MSRRAPGKDFSPVIDAAQTWINQSLVGDKSTLSDLTLWTPANLQDVHEAFVSHPDLGKDSFMTKLKRQMTAASADAQKLMGEILWALLLFPANIKPKTKRQQVLAIWSMGGVELEEGPLLQDEILRGIGSGGPGFNNHRWREVAFLVESAISLKAMDVKSRGEVFDSYDQFLDWIETVPREGHRQFRHMLRYFAFPDRVERMSSNSDRRTILDSFQVATKA